MTRVYLSEQMGNYLSENSYSGQSMREMEYTSNVDALNIERGGYIGRLL